MAELKGIKQQLKDRIAALEKIKNPTEKFVDEEIIHELASLTAALSRELCVYFTRGGECVYVTLGESDRADLAALTMRRSESRLSGIRCIHTHPGGNGMLSSVDIQSLKNLKFDAMCAIGVNENGASNASMAVLDDSDQGYHILAVNSAYKIPHDIWLEEIRHADTVIGSEKLFSEQKEAEKLLLIGKDEESLKELQRLADTAGGEAVYTAVQKNAKGIIGKGKAEELALIIQSKGIKLAIYDDELTSAQRRILEESLGVRVIDRTALILDIFAMRAVTKEGKMQVELAQLQYRLSHLKGEGEALSRQAGGIGTRGPGEAKLETDKRYINRRIYELRTQLNKISQHRGVMRKQRQKQQLPQIALVGYTNAGKSTLLKALSGSEVFCEDKLFATLDPLTRRCELDKNLDACITDTVGFIKKLPHQLVEAFRSTLEETVFADILLHVCDASSSEMFEQIDAVNSVLSQIGASDIPTLIVVNKCDSVEKQPIIKNAVYISAKTGSGIDELKAAIIQMLKTIRSEATVLVPYSRGDVIAYIHSHCKVQEEKYNDEGTLVTFFAQSSDLEKINAMIAK